MIENSKVNIIRGRNQKDLTAKYLEFEKQHHIVEVKQPQGMMLLMVFYDDRSIPAEMSQMTIEELNKTFGELIKWD